MLQRIIPYLLLGVLLASCTVGQGDDTTSVSTEYKTITISELQALMQTEEFTFINVHIPLEGSIPGTDAEIPYDEIQNYLEQLPANKNDKIIIYCRSGSMGITASQTLVDMGYTDVSNLEGGYIAWRSNGLPFEE